METPPRSMLIKAERVGQAPFAALGGGRPIGIPEAGLPGGR